MFGWRDQWENWTFLAWDPGGVNFYEDAYAQQIM